MKQKWHRKTKW